MSLKRTMMIGLMLFAVSSTALADAYMLRGPKPAVGDVLRSETKMEMADGTIDINAGGMRLAGKTSMTMHNITQTTVLEMEDDRITKVKIEFKRDVQEQVMEMMGQRTPTNTEGALHGRTVIGTLNGDNWSFELEDEAPANAMQIVQLRAMADSYQFPNQAEIMYPDREVKIGESWEVDAAKMRSHFSGAEQAVGNVTITLDKVEEVDGEKRAYLTVEMEMSADMTNEGEGKMTMTAKGPVVRSLKTFLDQSSDLQGTMEIKMSQGDDMEMTMSGPMKITAGETRP